MIEQITGQQMRFVKGDVHRLANLVGIPFGIIEVQSDGYLSEDDIVHFEVHCGRSQI